MNAAAALELDGDRIVEPRIALGAVAPTPIRAVKAEALLDGQAVDATLLDEAAKISVTESKPIDDFRASKSYRRQLIRTLTRRVLERSVEIARERQEKDKLH